MPSETKSTAPRRGRPPSDVSRNAILQSALAEFAREGLAGARMEAIAEAAGVNKALLYYYFKDKETLYAAILDAFFEPLAVRVLSVCDQPGTAGERFLAYARAHFDAIAESQHYARIFMSELMSASRGNSLLLNHVFERYMRPIGGMVAGLLQEGVKTREFRAIDPNHFLPSAIGSIVHYFLTAPVRQKFMPGVDFNTPEAIAERRAATLDFLAAALFADREQGLRLAAAIAAKPAESAEERKGRSGSPAMRESERVVDSGMPPRRRRPAGRPSAKPKKLKPGDKGFVPRLERLLPGRPRPDEGNKR